MSDLRPTPGAEVPPVPTQLPAEPPKVFEEVKKFMPPTIIWAVIIVLVAWAIQTYLPPEYSMYIQFIWILLIGVARYLGVSSQQLIEVGAAVGVSPNIPPGMSFAKPESETKPAFTIKPVDPDKVGRTLL